MTSITIAIPVHNGSNFIKDAINSVITQKYENYELVVIDNASTDNTVKIVEEFKKKFNKIKLYKNKKNIGSTGNFNKCLMKAKKEYFMLLSHDDFLLPGFLNEYANIINKTKADIVYSSYNIVDENKKFVKTKHAYEYNKLFTSKEAIFELSINPFASQLGFYKIETLKKTDGYETDYGPYCDAALFLKTAKLSKKISFLCKPLFCHRSHSSQGQNAFINYNLKVIGEHWGEKLDETFFSKHSNNYSFYRFVKLLHENIEEKDRFKVIKNYVFQELLTSNLRSVFITLLNLRFKILNNELFVFSLIFNMIGLKQFIYLGSKITTKFLLSKILRKKN